MRERGDSLEEELPGDVSGVGEAGLRHLGADRVDDGRLLLLTEEEADGAGEDKLRQVDEEVLLDQVIIVHQQQHLVSLQCREEQ